MNLSKLKSATAITPSRTGGISPFSELELHMIDPNPDQPRKHFDPIALEELADSIRTHGLIQPISVVRRGFRYMIVSGERRFQAYKIMGSRTIRAHILTVDDHAVQEMALIENIQREDLSDFEKAKFIGQLWASGKYPHKQDLARAIGKPPAWLSKAFGCLRLDPTIIADIEENKHDIGLSILEEISRLHPSTQKNIYDRYVAGEIRRDQFKTAAQPSEKISRGKKSTRYARGDELCVLFTDCDLSKEYKVTIEEL